jgi:hypothetical protein
MGRIRSANGVAGEIMYKETKKATIMLLLMFYVDGFVLQI